MTFIINIVKKRIFDILLHEYESIKKFINTESELNYQIETINLLLKNPILLRFIYIYRPDKNKGFLCSDNDNNNDNIKQIISIVDRNDFHSGYSLAITLRYLQFLINVCVQQECIRIFKNNVIKNKENIFRLQVKNSIPNELIDYIFKFIYNN